MVDRLGIAVGDGTDLKLVSLHSVTLPPQPPQLTVPHLKLDDYPGAYRWGPERVHAFAVRNGRLSFTTRAGGTPTDVRMTRAS